MDYPHVFRQRLLPHGKSVVLAGHLDFFGVQVDHGVVGAVVAELELIGLPTQGQGDIGQGEPPLVANEMEDEPTQSGPRQGDPPQRKQPVSPTW